MSLGSTSGSTRRGPLQIRVSTSDLADWKTRAAVSGVSLSEFIRQAVYAFGGFPTPREDAATVGDMVMLAPPKTSSRRPRAQMCEHRRAPGMYCSRCD